MSPVLRSAPATRRQFLTCALAAGAGCARGWGKEPVRTAPASAALIAWSREILAAIKTSANSPCQAGRNLAIIFPAALDAVLAQQNRPTLVRPGNGLAQPKAPAGAAMAVACATAATALFPSQRAAFNQLLSRQLTAFSDDERAAAQQAGQFWAQAHLDARASDGASGNVTYIPSLAVGHWRRTPSRLRPPELPHWRKLQPFTLKAPDQFRLGPPPDLKSPEYADGWAEVKRIGSLEKSSRTAEETLIARFWSCFSYTITPAGHWTSVLNDVVLAQSMPLEKSLRALALLSMATADATIAAWDVKYAYELWRPIHAIRLAESDGNDATAPVEGWTPLLETPPHPEYISGHSTIGQAGAEVMRHLLGSDRMAIEAHSDTIKDTTRSFQSVQACVEEMSRSRVLGGIHFPFSTRLGQELGRKTATESIRWFEERLKA